MPHLMLLMTLLEILGIRTRYVGIAGVVVVVIAIGAIWLFMRRRNQQPPS